MPRADNLPFVNDSLAERAAVVLAHVVHRADRAVDVRNADHAVAARKFSRFVGRKFGLDGEFGEGHAEEHCQHSLFRADCGMLTADCSFYFGCSVCAIMIWRLKFSTIFSSRRTSVGRLVIDMVSILSCSLSSA